MFACSARPSTGPKHSACQTAIRHAADITTGTHNYTDQHRRFFYSASWQILEERIDHANTTSSYGTTDTVSQLFWGPRYIDELVVKRVDRSTTNPGSDWMSSDVSRWFFVSDAIYSTRVVLDEDALPASIDCRRSGNKRGERESGLIFPTGSQLAKTAHHAGSQ